MQSFLKFISGFKLASVLLLLLLLLTFFGTIEQVEYGLYKTINKYFTWKNWYVLPEITKIKGKELYFLPLPGAYWVCVVLFFNMLIGGVIRIKKTPQKIFVVISHFGILFMLLGGFVSHHWSQRGNMALYEGESSDFAQHYHDYSIEVAKLDDSGVATQIYVFDHEYTSKIPEEKHRALKLTHTELPFSISVNNKIKNARPVRVTPMSAGNTPTVDGYCLRAVELEKADEANFLGCVAETSTGDKFLLFSGEFQPYVIDHEGTKYAVYLRKSIWKMPFTTHLDDFNAEFFLSGKAKKFESYITREEEGTSEKVKIYMNNPMRYNGFTFFQASWGPPGGKADDRLYTVFEIVKNPADKWPEYSIYVTTIGLICHFAWTLFNFISRETRKNKKS